MRRPLLCVWSGLAAVGALGVGVACSGSVELDGLRFACSSSKECVPPDTCFRGECVPLSQANAGAGGAVDGGAVDGGSVDGGGGSCVRDHGRELCGDGRDNDCDGRTDCEDVSCVGQACGEEGQVCGGGRCVCTGNGGVPEAPEVTCSDGVDNDCDGLADCADPDCAGTACGGAGRTCVGGACACSGNGGAPEAREQSCADGRDNDCDGRRDCEDPDCGGGTCAPSGQVCAAGACVCPPDAGQLGTPELQCGDNRDDDCNGAVDCADVACSGQACGPNKQCVGTVCTCFADGGAPEDVERACGDGQDGDCDGLTDCADPDCAGASCGASGQRCSASSCSCSGNGGAAEATESTCGDGADNDCDGRADCADPDCDGLRCAGTSSCAGGQCQCLPGGAGPEATERTCSDGADNDCDGLADCADPDCAQQRCSAGSASSVCCGTACVDTAHSAGNCGGCGISCKPGQSCEAVQAGALASGRCSCNSSTQCPGPGAGGLADAQTCSGSVCACTTGSQCGSGQSCTASEGLGGPGWCHY